MVQFRVDASSEASQEQGAAASASTASKRPRAPALMALLGYSGTSSIDRERGRVEMAFEPRAEHCHSGGIVQGGIITGWLDAAMASAVFVRGGSGTSMASLEIKTVYYEAIRLDRGPCTVQAWIERLGRRTAFVEACVLDAAGTILAKASSTVSVRSPATAQAAVAANADAARPAAGGD
ncbi:MAG: PaaI family thioesterase [Gammaproteobacteria bacterium]|nr:PaaI family thioesterase [Gammaproteobacteria bacterium]